MCFEAAAWVHVSMGCIRLHAVYFHQLLLLLAHLLHTQYWFAPAPECVLW